MAPGGREIALPRLKSGLNRQAFLMRDSVEHTQKPETKMQIHVLYSLLRPARGSWANTPMGRLPGGHRRVVAQLPKRVSDLQVVDNMSERAERIADMDALV